VGVRGLDTTAGKVATLAIILAGLGYLILALAVLT
jgi:hypothetical protein